MKGVRIKGREGRIWGVNKVFSKFTVCVVVVLGKGRSDSLYPVMCGFLYV